MNQEIVKPGVIVPILTPIDQNELIDEKRLREQIDFVIAGGVTGILLFGSNGEFYMVEESEMERALKITVEHTKGRVPVFFGIGAIPTGKCIRLAKMARSFGADAVSVLAPMFIRPTEEELFRHYSAIAGAVSGFPVLIYNNPGRTGYTLSAGLVEKMAHEIPNIIGIKDSSGDLTQTEEFIRRNRDIGFKVFAGKDTLIYASMCCGAVGCVATTANFVPKEVCSIVGCFLEGDYKKALEAQYRLNPVRLAMDKSSWPVSTKDMANMVGRDVGKPYLPNLQSEGAVYDSLLSALKKAGMI